MDNNSENGWTQAAPAALVKGSPEWFEKRDSMLADWEASKRALEVAKEAEMKLRKEVVDFNFNHEQLKGTERVPLANGYELKAVKKLNYNLVSPVEGGNVIDAVDSVLTQIEAIGPEGKFIAERLVKWSAELSVSEYNKLDDMGDTGKKIHALIDTVVETKPGAPTLEIVQPKGAKK